MSPPDDPNFLFELWHQKRGDGERKSFSPPPPPPPPSPRVTFSSIFSPLPPRLSDCQSFNLSVAFSCGCPLPRLPHLQVFLILSSKGREKKFHPFRSASWEFGGGWGGVGGTGEKNIPYLGKRGAGESLLSLTRSMINKSFLIFLCNLQFPSFSAPFFPLARQKKPVHFLSSTTFFLIRFPLQLPTLVSSLSLNIDCSCLGTTGPAGD